jgi:SAM-dependent methyltransferase
MSTVTVDACLNSPADYLLGDQFIRCPIQASTLISAMRMGVLQRIDACKNTKQLRQFALESGIAYNKLILMLAMLARSGVLDNSDGNYKLTKSFQRALKFTDLIFEKVRFSNLIAEDYLGNTEAFFRGSAWFQESSKIFELFDYSSCIELSKTNLSKTASWMNYTTTLTKYESGAFLSKIDLSGYRRMIDVGGNSGEFAYRLCSAYPCLRAVVADLPVVCHLGKRHLQALQDGQHVVDFMPWDLRQYPLPGGFDLISFKSVLHDWPEDHVIGLLQEAYDSLPLGGSVVIFERQTWDYLKTPIDFSNLPIALFCDSYRDPGIYIRMLLTRAWQSIRVFTLQLDSTFMLLLATK